MIRIWIKIEIVQLAFLSIEIHKKKLKMSVNSSTITLQEFDALMRSAVIFLP
jgi:hypothetical protein